MFLTGYLLGNPYTEPRLVLSPGAYSPGTKILVCIEYQLECVVPTRPLAQLYVVPDTDDFTNATSNCTIQAPCDLATAQQLIQVFLVEDGGGTYTVEEGGEGREKGGEGRERREKGGGGRRREKEGEGRRREKKGEGGRREEKGEGRMEGEEVEGGRRREKGGSGEGGRREGEREGEGGRRREVMTSPKLLGSSRHYNFFHARELLQVRADLQNVCSDSYLCIKGNRCHLPRVLLCFFCFLILRRLQTFR
jgi:hypothetical protein